MRLGELRSIILRGNGPRNTACLGLVIGTLAISPLMAEGPSDWPMFGQSVANNAAATTPGNSMSPSHIAKLKPKWALTTGGDVSARAAVVNGVVYFPDWVAISGRWIPKAGTWSGPISFRITVWPRVRPHQSNRCERPDVHRSAVHRIRADRVVAGDQCVHWRIGVEEATDDVEPLPGHHRFTRCGGRRGVRTHDLERGIRCGRRLHVLPLLLGKRQCCRVKCRHRL